jgi:hypothetical protein
MDNKLLNINGRKEDLLAKAIDLAIAQGGWINTTITGWYFDPQYGIILTTWEPGSQYNKFLTPLSAEETAGFVFNWLSKDEAKTVPLGQWEGDIDHDGHNTPGWRLYSGDWGHVGDDWSALCAIKRVYLWYGK